MKNSSFLALLGFCLFLAPSPAHAEEVFSIMDIAGIEQSSELDIYFMNVAAPVIKYDRKFRKDFSIFLDIHPSLFFTPSTDEEIKKKADDSMLINAMGGGVIPLNAYVSIPLFASVTAVKKEGATFYGTGLIAHTSLGSLGGFAGFKSATTPEGEGEKALHFSLVPLLDTRKYPLLGLIFKSINSYFGYEQNEKKDIDYSVKPFFNEWKLGPFVLDSLYYKDEKIGPDGRNKVYGVKGGITGGGPRSYSLFVEGGCRDYYDVTRNAAIYEDTRFITAAFSLADDWQELFVNFYTTFYEKQAAKVPRFGCNAGMEIFYVGLDFTPTADGFYMNFAFSFMINVGAY
jgi:hypothetical protein